VLVTIVTPTLNEEDELPRRAREIEGQEPPWEWIVADGGSTDRTVAVARQLGAHVVETRRGRGRQLNAGVAPAHGEALLFLHADTSMPPSALATLRRALRDERVVGGHFRLRFGDGTVTDRFFDCYQALRDKLFGGFYGDSAIFARSSAFKSVDGFPDEPLFEDVDLVKRLRAVGSLVSLEPIVSTSSRRYRGRPLRTVALWAALLLLRRAGISPQKLAWLYPPAGKRRIVGA
jgi:rSAM/selenodomain-associated transferase 2